MERSSEQPSDGRQTGTGNGLRDMLELDKEVERIMQEIFEELDVQ